MLERNESIGRSSEADNGPIAALLGELGRVVAPPDFYARVRARIANGRAAGSKTVGFPVGAKLFVGSMAILLLAVGIGMLVIWNGRSDRATVEERSDGSTPNQVAPSNLAVATPAVSPPGMTVAGTRGTTPTPREAAPELHRGTTGGTMPKERGSSMIEAANEARRVLPRGISTNSAVPNWPNNLQNGHIAIGDLLSQMGIKATAAAGGLHVDSLTANGTGERAGLRVGDTIESINDEAVSAKTTFSGQFTGKNMRVRRDGKTVEINLLGH